MGIGKELIRLTLRHTGGNVLRAAQLLQVTRDRLRYRIAKYGIDAHSDEYS